MITYSNRILPIIAAIGATALMASSSLPSAVGAATTTTSSGAPSGAHYNLNIIGVPNEKTADMTGDNGHRIFVPLKGSTKIWLQPANSFQVLDANGTDGSASFQMPTDVTSTYEVYVRALGKPAGHADMTSCTYDATLDSYFCDTSYSVSLDAHANNNKFTNSSSQLLYVTDPTTGQRTALFSDSALDYYWQYDNNGLKIAQLRFYPKQ
jgi:hypothetical protein